MQLHFTFMGCKKSQMVYAANKLFLLSLRKDKTKGRMFWMSGTEMTTVFTLQTTKEISSYFNQPLLMNKSKQRKSELTDHQSKIHLPQKEWIAN